MDSAANGNKEETSSSHAKLRFWAFVIMGAMLCIELINAVRIWTDRVSPRVFPYNYVSKGIWSFGAFVRPLDSDSGDFFPPLNVTYNMLHGNPDLYCDFKLEGCIFPYPPTATTELVGFAYLARPPDFSTAFKLADLIGRLCMFGTIAIAAWFLSPIVGNKRHWVLVILILAAFFPIRWCLMCVNVQSFITFFLAVLILAYAKSRNFLAGIMLALAACLKPYLALLLLFAAFRKQCKFIVGAVVTAGILILASIIVVGISPWQTYLFDVLPVLSRGYGYYPNHSINGIAHRWLGHSTEIVVGPKSIIVSIATWMSAIVFIGLSVCPRPIKRLQHHQNIPMPSEPTNQRLLAVQHDVLFRAIDVAIALLAVTLASPIVWDHYYALCIVLFSVCLAINNSTVLNSRFLGVLAGSYILLGTYFLTVKTAVSGPLTLINATHFFGAILLLGSAWYAQTHLQRA